MSPPFVLTIITAGESKMNKNAIPMPLGKQATFCIFSLMNMPSILCYLVLFYYFLRLPELRQQYYSHLMIIYLLLSGYLVIIIDIPLILAYIEDNYFILSMKYPQVFCTFWIVYDYSTWSINLWIMALLSLERYLLIFFKQAVMKNKKRRFLMYYFPITIIVLLVFCWYLYLLILFPCTKTYFDFTAIICGSACYQIEGSEMIQNLDWIISGLLPVFLTVLFTLILIIHVLYQRHKIRRHVAQRDTWKRTRKMFLQLLPITLTFLVFIMPLIIVGLMAIINPWYFTTPYFYVNFLAYCLPLAIPFAVLSKQKVIRRRLLLLLRCREANRIAPVILVNDPPVRKMNAPRSPAVNDNTLF